MKPSDIDEFFDRVMPIYAVLMIVMCWLGAVALGIASTVGFIRWLLA